MNLDRMISPSNSDQYAAFSEKAGFSDPSFFLVGLPRSGTTLLQSIISASSNLWLSPESHWLPYLIGASQTYVESYKNRQRPEQREEVWKDALRLFTRHLVKRPGHWGLQTIGLNNVHYIDYLAKLYPHSKFIYLIRDPRDILLSMMRTGIAVFPSEFAKVYAKIKELKEIQNDRLIIVRYEDIVLKPEEIITDLTTFLGCSYNQSMLYPLTQRLSGNQEPALSEKDLKTGVVSVNSAVVQRWKRQMLDEDLLDLNFLFSHLKLHDYEVYEKQNMQLTIVSRKEFSGRLIGAKLNSGGDTIVNKKEERVDICSIGVVGIEIMENEDSVQRIHLEGFGDFRSSDVYKNTFLLRLIPEKPTQTIRTATVHTWPLFHEIVGLPPNSKIAIYTAGGATESFLEHVERFRSVYRWDCIIDQSRKGTLAGLPIMLLDEALTREIDYILITSAPHYGEIRNELLRRGLKELDDFCLVCFANQNIG